jgi:Ca2+/H+ antiporter, TMEM165/GDT1 family
MHALRLAAYVFGVIFVAELPDKTALAALVLATRHKPLAVFLGAALALTVQSIVAVAAGSLLSLVAGRAVHIGAGIVFFASAALMWLRKESGEQGKEGDAKGDRKDAAEPGEPGEPASKRRPSPSFARALATVFGVVFIAEWGDLTQFATAAFAARERAPLVVFGAATLALWAVTAIAVGVGHRAGKLLDPNVTRRVAAGLFAVVGIALVTGRL